MNITSEKQIRYYHQFIAQIFSNFDHQELLQMTPVFFFDKPHLFLCPFPPSFQYHKIFQTNLVFALSQTWDQHFFKDSWFLLLENAVQKPRGLGVFILIRESLLLADRAMKYMYVYQCAHIHSSINILQSVFSDTCGSRPTSQGSHQSLPFPYFFLIYNFFLLTVKNLTFII